MRYKKHEDPMTRLFREYFEGITIPKDYYEVYHELEDKLLDDEMEQCKKEGITDDYEISVRLNTRAEKEKDNLKKQAEKIIYDYTQEALATRQKEVEDKKKASSIKSKSSIKNKGSVKSQAVMEW